MNRVFLGPLALAVLVLCWQPLAQAEKVAIPNAIKSELSPLVKLNGQELGAFMMEIHVHSTLTRGPIVRKLFRDTTIHYDAAGRWHLIKIDPLQNDRWEIYSLGQEQSQLYLRKNNEAFRFAADPAELARWLETALQDFYGVVQPMRQALINKDDEKLKVTEKKVFNLSVRCARWVVTNEATVSKRLVNLCLSEDAGAIVEGSIEEIKTDSAGDYPLVTQTKAVLRLTQSGKEVKPVTAPVVK